MAETAMGAALRFGGIVKEDVEFDVAIAKYLNSGGTIERALARLNVAAARMSGMGQTKHAESQMTTAQTRQQVEDDGACSKVPQSHAAVAPSSSPNRGGEGLITGTPKGQKAVALPDREAKPHRAAIDFGAAAHAIKTKLAQTVLDRVKTSDGRSWGDVGAHELDGMSRDGALAQAIKAHIGVLSNAQRFLTVRDLVKAETFEAIRSKVHGA